MANKQAKGRPPVKNPAIRTLGGVRISEEQLKKYKKAAEKQGVALSAWVRDILDNAANKA